MTQYFTHPDAFRTEEILAKVEKYGVTRETAQNVLRNADAVRLERAAGLPENALEDFWRPSQPDFSTRNSKTPELCWALKFLGFRPEIIDRVRLRVYLDNNTQTLLEWGKMIAGQARDLESFPHLFVSAKIEAGLGRNQPVPLGERWKGVDSPNDLDGADIL